MITLTEEKIKDILDEFDFNVAYNYIATHKDEYGYSDLPTLDDLRQEAKRSLLYLLDPNILSASRHGFLAFKTDYVVELHFSIEVSRRILKD